MIDITDQELDKAFWEAADEYQRVFGDRFPTIPLMWDGDFSHAIELMNECLREGKDVYAMGMLSSDTVIKY